jgi:hypothetical protein
MKNDLIADGWHVLTGIGETTVYDDWYNTTADAVVFQLDGRNFIVYADKDDGFRSYGRLHETDERPQMTFPPQSVHAFTEVVDTFDGEILHLENEDGEPVLEIGTDNSDAYYPLAIFHWYPENLPVNKRRRFDVSLRSEIESGKYRVVNSEGKPVRIICWDMRNAKPVVALVDEGGFELIGRYSADDELLAVIRNE